MILIAAVALSATAATAQRQSNLDSLIARVMHGDAASRDKLGTIAWPLATEGAQRALTLDEAATLARAALAMGSPFARADEARSPREIEWRGSAVRALLRVLELDSANVWAATQLESLAPYPHIWREPAVELSILRSLNARHAEVPSQLATTLVALELEIGSLDSAAAMLLHLPNGVAEAQRFHLASQLQFAFGDRAAGQQLYFEGAAAIRDSAGAAAFSRDLEWIADSAELKAWNALPLAGVARRAWLDAFWTRRDLEDAQLPGTRLGEQFRRWRLALKAYRWDSDGSTAAGIPDLGFAVEFNRGDITGSVRDIMSRSDTICETEVSVPIHKRCEAWAIPVFNRLRAQSRILDDRGWLVMRHGDPVRLPLPPGNTSITEENLAWQTPGGRLVVGFSRIRIASSRFGMVARNIPMGDMMTSCSFDSRLCFGKINKVILADYVKQRETAESTDNNAERFRNDLGAVVQAFGIVDGGTLVVLGIPVSKLIRNDSTLAATRDFSVHLRAIIGSLAAGTIATTLDTTRSWHTATALNPGMWLTAYFIVPVAPGTWDVSVVVGTDDHDAGTGQRIAKVPVVAFRGDALRMSDPITGRAGSGLSWSRNGERVPLNPTNAWLLDEPAIVTYEVDGVIPGRNYQVQYEVWPTGSDSKSPALSIGEKVTGSAPRITVQRELALSRLKPGDYRLVIRMTDLVTRAEVSRERRIAVRK